MLIVAAERTPVSFEAHQARAKPSVWHRLCGHWKELVGSRPEDELLVVSEGSADNPGLLILAFIGALAALAVIASLRDGGEILSVMLPIAGIAAIFEVATQLLERRHPRALWLMMLKVGFYSMTTGAALWAVLAGEMRARFRRPATLRLANRVGGGFLIGAGLLTVVARRV